MSDSIIRLQSATVDVVIKARPFAEIIYWGPHLSHFSPQDADSLTRPVANGRLDVDSPVTLMAELGHGLFGAPGIEGHRQGLDASPIFATSKVRHEGQTLTLVSEDPHAGLRLYSEIALDASGVLSVRHGVTNLRVSPWQVDRLAVTLPVAERAREVMAFHGRWIREFQPHRLTLEHDSFVLENRRGRTSHEHFPALITGSHAFSEMQGEVWGVHLAWSGNHRLRAEVKTDGRRYLQAEALYLPGEMALAEGETLWTPYLYASYSANGLNGMSQQFHRYLRERIIRFPGNKPRPVPLANQMTGGAIRARLVIEIKPGVGLRQAATAQREKRKAGREQLNQARVVVQGMRDDQRIDATALHHAHIAVFIGLFIIGDQQ